MNVPLLKIVQESVLNRTLSYQLKTIKPLQRSYKIL